ncbi:MAG: PQQ-like beta-propeller repeat protein [Planctomycetales bacterium]|nr:PQQ-like beta-propeller repeat protein [Planctomycetales bacterium]
MPFVCIGAMVALASFVHSGDWPHWRGPLQNGVSVETDLPERWSASGENLLWRNEAYATRSTPIVMNGRLYTICRAFPETTQEGERVVCVDPDSGELIWEAINNVFLSDAPAERVGWSSVVGDVDTGNIYSLGLGCFFQCLDGATGKRLWSRSLSEEYGMLSTYGGRTNFPIVFDDLVIISGVMTGWGEYAVPAHRFVAFDKRTGDAVWIASTRQRPEDTTYSTPVITTFNGQAAMVFGAGDGSVYALQPRTGKVIWKYDASNRGINTTPLVADGIVYCGHSEQNTADTTVLGALFALDGRAKSEVKETDMLWKIPSRTIGRCQPLLVGDRLYAIDDGGTLWVVDAKTGKDIARQKLGRIMFGSMVYGDGKIYVGEATGRWYVLQPTDHGVKVVHQLRLNNEEILGSPIIAGGRIYLPTNAALYCIGNASSTRQTLASRPAVANPARPYGEETPAQDDTTVAHLQIVPVEAIVRPGGKQQFTVRAFNANGQIVQQTSAKVRVIQGGGDVDSNGEYSAPRNASHSIEFVGAQVGDIKSTARVRVIPPFPWTWDFSNKQVPVTWVGAAYRHQPRDVDGESTLVKVSTIPKGTRSQSWMGPTDLHDYTIQADFLAPGTNGKTPDMGLINQRYTLAMNSQQELQIRSWTSRLELRFAKTIPFRWESGTWYTMKFQSENAGQTAVLRGKVWQRGTSEPAEWTIEAVDATPNTTGSPGMFGNASDSEFLIDNVKVYDNN